jgi:hypothetical protein
MWWERPTLMGRVNEFDGRLVSLYFLEEFESMTWGYLFHLDPTMPAAMTATEVTI